MFETKIKSKLNPQRIHQTRILFWQKNETHMIYVHWLTKPPDEKECFKNHNFHKYNAQTLSLILSIVLGYGCYVFKWTILNWIATSVHNKLNDNIATVKKNVDLFVYNISQVGIWQILQQFHHFAMGQDLLRKIEHCATFKQIWQLREKRKPIKVYSLLSLQDIPLRGTGIGITQRKKTRK